VFAVVSLTLARKIAREWSGEGSLGTNGTYVKWNTFLTRDFWQFFNKWRTPLYTLKFSGGAQDRDTISGETPSLCEKKESIEI